MPEINVLVENLVRNIGLTGQALFITTHIVLTLLVILAAWISYLVCHRLIMPMMVKIAAKTEVEWDDILLNPNTLKAGCKIVPAVVVWALLPKVYYHFLTVEEILTRITAIYITFASMHFCIEFINSFKGFEGEKRTALQQYFHTFCGVIKIAIIFIAVIIMTAIAIDRSPTTLLAGLGATSAVLMLVFKDTITGLVAGIRLTSNDMLHKGDWITVDKAGINGIVEDITLTTVKVRNFDNTIVTITPQTLVDDSFQNWLSMWNGGGRRVKRVIYFDFRSICLVDTQLKEQLVNKKYMKKEEMNGDVVNLTLFRRYVERWLKDRDDVNEEMLFMVRQLEATNTGLPVEIYCFVKLLLLKK